VISVVQRSRPSPGARCAAPHRWSCGVAAGAAAVVVSAALAGCGGDHAASDDQTTSTTRGPDFGRAEDEFSGSGPAVVILGDSLVVEVRDRLHELLDPDNRTKIAAFIGEGFAGGPLSAVLETAEPTMLDVAARYADDGADVVVLALGTNDALQPELGVTDAVAGLREIVGRFPDACVVGVEVNPWSAAEGYETLEAASINAELQAVADVMVESLTPAQTGDDQIHPNAAGREALANGIADSVRQCGS
jgi:lysophospholipase L1-like esterase